MEVHEITVKTAASLTLPFEETIVMPIGDVQMGAQGCDLDRLKRDIDWGIKHNAYFLGMGEFCDVASPSNRKALRTAALYDSVDDLIEEAHQRQIEEFLKVVKGTKGRWLGMLEGHHFYEFRDGTTTDTRIAKELGTMFLGSCAFVRILFNRGIRNKADISCTIWAHHGAGGGQKVSAPLNRLENLMPYFDADIYLIGHQHKKVGAPTDQLYMTRNTPYDIKHRTKMIACTGGYLKGYYKGATQDGVHPRGSYVERGMKTPVALGGVLLFIRPVHTHYGDRLDLNIGV